MSDQREVFDDLWNKSSKWKRRFQYNIEAARKDFLYALARNEVSRSRQTVLDIGFGGGTMIFQFDKSCAIYGTDFSEVAIAGARTESRRLGYRDAEFTVPSDPHRLDFPSGRFDVVVASHVVEHVPDDMQLIREIVRVLKPGGIAVIIIPLEANQDGILSDAELARKPAADSADYHLRYYNFETFLERLKAIRHAEGRSVGLRMAWPDMACWDLKCRLDSVRRNSLPGPLDRVVAGCLNIPLSVLPRGVMFYLDRAVRRAGYRYRQGTYVLGSVR